MVYPNPSWKSPKQFMDIPILAERYWLVVWTPLKNISQLGWLFPIYGKIKNVPNHQPDYMATPNAGRHPHHSQSASDRCPTHPWPRRRGRPRRRSRRSEASWERTGTRIPWRFWSVLTRKNAGFAMNRFSDCWQFYHDTSEQLGYVVGKIYPNFGVEISKNWLKREKFALNPKQTWRTQGEFGTNRIWGTWAAKIHIYTRKRQVLKVFKEQPSWGYQCLRG